LDWTLRNLKGCGEWCFFFIAAFFFAQVTSM
jgi:hypothetical protein